MDQRDTARRRRITSPSGAYGPSSAGRSKVMSAGVAIAAVSTIGFFGFLIGPPLIGMIAGISSLRVSFVVIAVMGLSIALITSFKKLD